MKDKKLPKGIRIKNGSYEARCMLNGKTISLYGKDLDKLIKDFEEAKRLAQESVNNMSADSITLDKWFDEWFLNVKAPKVKETSRIQMKRSYARTFGFYVGAEKLKDLRPLDLQKVVNTLSDQGMAHSTIRDSLGRLKECLGFAVASGMISSNPALLVEVPWEFKSASKEFALTPEEVDRFLDEARYSFYLELFHFAFLTGARVGEIGGLRWSDISFERKEIYIRHSLSCGYFEGVKHEKLVAPKTQNSYRTIPFIGDMENILLLQKEKCRKLKAELKHRWRAKGELEDVVFFTSLGSPASRYVVDKEIKKIVKRMTEKEITAAVLEGRNPVIPRVFHPHTMRHTFATRCFEAGIEPKVAQQLLGHSSISQTLNIYTHVTKSKMMQETGKLDGMITLDKLEENIKIPELSLKSFL